MTPRKPTPLPVTSEHPTQLVLGWGLGLAVVGRKRRKRKGSPHPWLAARRAA